MGQIKPHANILTVWRIWLVLAMLLPAFLNSLLLRIHSRAWLLGTILWVAVLLTGYVFYLPQRYRKLSFSMEPDRIVLYSGVLYTRVRAVPLGNIQYTALVRSPLDSLFGLCSLTAVAAGGRITLPGLRAQEAEQLAGVLDDRS